jgi:hypothetical protein
MSDHGQDIRRSITPLRLIFWGGLIVVFDVRIGRFDLVNDLVGMIMITWGVFRLSDFTARHRYSMAMIFIKVVAVLGCLVALHDHFVYQVPAPLSTVLLLTNGVAAVAIVVFCLAMRWLSTEAGLSASAKSWRTTTRLFAALYLLPLGAVYLAAAVAAAMGRPFDVDFNFGELGLAGVLLLPLVLLLLGLLSVPPLHLFLSMSRMSKEAGTSAEIRRQGAAPDGASAALHPRTVVEPREESA